MHVAGGQARGRRTQREEAARHRIRRRAGALQGKGCRGDVQRGKIVAAERRHGRVAHRQRDAPLQPPGGIEAQQAAAAEHGADVEALAIDRRAIGAAVGTAFVHSGEHPLVVRRAAVLVVVAGPDGLGWRVRVVQGTAVGTEGQAVRDAHRRQPERDQAAVPVVTPERPCASPAGALLPSASGWCIGPAISRPCRSQRPSLKQKRRASYGAAPAM